MNRLIFLLWLLAAVPHSVMASDQLTAPGLAALEALIGDAIADARITAAVALVDVEGTVEFQLAAGEMEPGTPMRSDPILPLASVGKMYTATAAMILLERELVELEDPVSKFIPEFANAMVSVENNGKTELVVAARPMTVYHLLTHTAGFVVEGNDFWGVWGAHVGTTTSTTTDFARDLLKLNLQSHPGDRFNYGQTGAAYEVLGAVIEIASGQTLEAFMKDNIFEPLSLDDSYFYLPDEKAERLPAIYRMTDEGLVLDRKAGEDFSRSTFFHGGGGVRSAPADVLKFARMLLNNGEVEGIRILQAETVAIMMQDHLGDLAPDYWKPRGLSWGFGGAVTYSDAGRTAGIPDQYGWVGGGFAKLWIDPRRKMIAYINFPLTPPGDNQLLRDFETLVYEGMKTGE